MGGGAPSSFDSEDNDNDNYQQIQIITIHKDLDPIVGNSRPLRNLLSRWRQIKMAFAVVELWTKQPLCNDNSSTPGCPCWKGCLLLSG